MSTPSKIVSGVAWHLRMKIAHNINYIRSYIKKPRESEFINSKSIVLWIGQTELCYTMMSRYIVGVRHTQSEDADVVEKTMQFLGTYPEEGFKELSRKAMALVWGDE